jgi:hypothetical protein
MWSVRVGYGFRCDQGMPMCEGHNMGQHTFVPACRVGLGQPTMSLPESAVGWSIDVWIIRPISSFFEDGRP